MQKWEYRVVNCYGLSGAKKVDVLNQLGEEGWQLVSVTFTDDGTNKELYLKRPKN
ncbi:MAG: DUF4177 domain-containing protein [Bryobacterales bacterium]|nr:DUF4177 domain-containing protein [Bryobacterales bacterium]